MPVYSIVGSSGRTATHWFAAVLNIHPAIFAVHGPDLHPSKDSSEEEDLEKHRRIVKEMHSFNFQDADAYFDILEEHKPFSIYVSVHGISPVMPRIRKFKRKFYSCALLRHPVSRINSFVARWNYEQNIGSRPKANDDDLFVEACNEVLLSDRQHAEYRVPLFPMETIVSDRAKLFHFLGCVTQHSVTYTDKHLSQAMTVAPIDVRAEQLSPEQIYAGWSTAQRDTFLTILDDAKIAPVYGNIGYDLLPFLSGRPSEDEKKRAECSETIKERFASAGRSTKGYEQTIEALIARAIRHNVDSKAIVSAILLKCGIDD